MFSDSDDEFNCDTTLEIAAPTYGHSAVNDDDDDDEDLILFSKIHKDTPSKNQADTSADADDDMVVAKDEKEDDDMDSDGLELASRALHTSVEGGSVEEGKVKRERKKTERYKPPKGQSCPPPLFEFSPLFPS
jgi:hypothetical protein